VISYLQIVKLAHKNKWFINTVRQLGYGRETARVVDFKGVSHFEAKF